jgi:NlpC/P60 family putative phage cell wall peptidase
MTTREKSVEVARTWIGTPYHHKAKVKGAGTDCGMILIAIFAEAGVIKDYEPEDYPADWMMHRSEERYLATVEKFAKKVEREPLPGDLVLFKFGRCISHGAIVTEWPNIIHAYKQAGCVVEENITTNQSLFDRLSGVWSVWNN